MVVTSKPTTTAFSFIELHIIPQWNGTTGEGIIIFVSFFSFLFWWGFLWKFYRVMSTCWPAFLMTAGLHSKF